MRKDTNRVIGALLRRLRKQAGLSQREVALRYGAPQSFVSKIELGDRSLALSETLAYAKALGMNDEKLYHEVHRALVAYTKRLQQVNRQQSQRVNRQPE